VAIIWEGRSGLVYAEVSEAGEREGDGTDAEHLELNLLPVDMAAEAVGSKIPVVAADTVTVQVVGISTLLGQRHAMSVRV
jgi:hypothetical protein